MSQESPWVDTLFISASGDKGLLDARTKGLIRSDHSIFTTTLEAENCNYLAFYRYGRKQAPKGFPATQGYTDQVQTQAGWALRLKAGSPSDLIRVICGLQ